MRQARKILSSFVVALLLAMLSPGVSAASTTSDEMFRPTGEPGLGYLGYTAYPFSSVTGSNAGLIGMKTENKKPTQINYCKSLNDPVCAGSDFFQYKSTLTFCESEIETDCIVDVYAENALGKALKVNKTDEFFTDPDHQYSEDLSAALPPGKSPPLVDIPEAPHAGGTLYLPLVSSYGQFDRVNKQKVESENGEIALFAVSKSTGQFNVGSMSTLISSYPERHWRSGFDVGSPCIYNDYNHCVKAHPLPLDVKFGIKIRNNGNIKGWFHGRITDPQVQQESGPGLGKTLTVWGKPIQVPSISIWKNKTELTDQIKNYYEKLKANEFPLGGSGSGAGNIELQNGPNENWSLMRKNNTGFGQSQMDEFLTWLPSVGDKANLSPTVWLLKLMTDYGTGGLINNECQRDLNDLTGVVSTNATQYLAGPPTYDAANNELIYQVAAPHLLPDGNLVRGTYDLSLRSDLARCLYGVTGTSFKVSVSVVSNNNELVEAVTNVVEKDGWFYFSAKGFTFSSPKIKVKFEREIPVTPASSSTNTPTQESSGQVTVQKIVKTPPKKSITCIKGKSIRKITGANPKCPAGFKKK